MTDSNHTDADRVTRRRTLKGIGAGVSLAALGGTGMGSVAASPGNGNQPEEPHPPGDSWRMFGKNSANTGHNPFSPAPRDNITSKWTFDTFGRLFGNPVVVGENLYIGDENGHMYKLDAETGNEDWRFPTESGITSTAMVSNGTLYFGQAGGDFYALDAETGDEIWSTHMGSSGAPAKANGILYLDSGGEVYALDAKTGTQHWKYSAGGYIGTQVAVKDGTVYVGDEFGDELLHALDAESGDVRWKKDLDWKVYTISVKDGTVYAGIRGNKVVAVDAETSDELWRSPKADSNVFVSAVDDDRVYYGTHLFWRGSKENSVYAVDRDTGELLWRTKTGNVSNPPAVVRGIVYAGNVGADSYYGNVEDNKLYALDAETGDEIWSDSKTGAVTAAPAVVDGTVYFGDKGGAYGSGGATVIALEEGQ